MIILGLGSNIGDRFEHLRKALKLLKNMPALTVQQISPIYMSDALLPDHAPASWDVPYLNLAIRCETTLAPHALLEQIKAIEKKVGRIPEIDWGPRIIDIDILAWDNLIKYDDKLHIPHEHLHERPFALWPLADVAPFWIYPLPGPLQGKTAMEIAAQWGPRHQGNAPFHIKQIPHRIDTPALVGIVNVTPDSFSDGGQFFDEERAFQQVVDLVDAGAEIIDIGAEATGPHAKPIDSEKEWHRLEPLLKKIVAEREHFLIPPKISIDTRQVATAKQALSLPVDWINDVSGLDDPAMREMLSKQSCDIVFMHHLGIPVSQSGLIAFNQDPVSTVYEWAEKRLAELDKAQIDRSRLIFDIGIGYGKNAEHSLELIKKAAIFHELGIRLLVGHSRKSFLTQLTVKPAAERDLETTVMSLYLAKQAIDYLRIHNVDSHARALKVNAIF